MIIPKTSITPHVAILMCTYNGESYLEDQLLSFENQNFKHWTLYVSDDGSQDSTLIILEKYKQKWLISFGENRIVIYSGPKRGFATNFLTLTCQDTINADFYAWADQDDIWLEDKVTRAIEYLSTQDPAKPLLYCTRTQLIDKNKHNIGLSPLFSRTPSFNNALIQSIAGGNTMVFNSKLRLQLIKAGPQVQVVAHDWWLYQIATGCGGVTYYDERPSVLYRQHGKNLIGGGTSFIDRIKRINMLVEGRFKHWNDLNILSLDRLRSEITPKNQLTLQKFIILRNSWIIKRVLILHHLKLYRQTKLGNFALFLSILLNRL